MPIRYMCVFFFFNDTATTEIYPLSLHDALPIYWPRLSSDSRVSMGSRRRLGCSSASQPSSAGHMVVRPALAGMRSEEHTSELQSQSNFVCRLLLEKKKRTTSRSRCERTR